jgi:hypothetical protein
MPEFLRDELHYPIPKEFVFYISLFLAIILKFASIEYLRLMLYSYLMLKKNQTFFVVTLFCVSAPSCLMAPFYTYDHDKCSQKNFMIDMRMSCIIQTLCLAITLLIIAIAIFYIITCLIYAYFDKFLLFKDNFDHLRFINYVPFLNFVIQYAENAD